MSHMRTSRSTPPLARVSPSGAKATDQTPCEWPRNVVSSRAPVFQYSRKSTGAVPVPDDDGVSGEGVGARWEVVRSVIYNVHYDENKVKRLTVIGLIANRRFAPV